jgi:hypothetical protein
MPFQSQKLLRLLYPLLEVVGWHSSTGYPVELIEAGGAGAEKGSRFAEGNRRSRRVSDLDAFGAEAILLALLHLWLAGGNVFPVPGANLSPALSNRHWGLRPNWNSCRLLARE